MSHFPVICASEPVDIDGQKMPENEGFGGQIQLLQSFFFSGNEASNMAHRRVNNRYYQDTRVCQLLFWATLMEEVGVP